MKKIELKTARLILRFYEAADYRALAQAINNDKIAKMTKRIPFPYSEADAKAFIASTSDHPMDHNAKELGIFRRSDQQLIGGIGISWNQHNHSGELGYWIAEASWGQGFCSEAAECLLEAAFTIWGYHKVYATCLVDNRASARVMIKQGMQYDGILRAELYRDEQFFDLQLYSILKPEYFPGK